MTQLFKIYDTFDNSGNTSHNAVATLSYSIPSMRMQILALYQIFRLVPLRLEYFVFIVTQDIMVILTYTTRNCMLHVYHNT